VKKVESVPEDFWINYLADTFVTTIKWWIDNGKKETAETLADYFMQVI